MKSQCHVNALGGVGGGVGAGAESVVDETEVTIYYARIYVGSWFKNSKKETETGGREEGRKREKRKEKGRRNYKMHFGDH